MDPTPTESTANGVDAHLLPSTAQPAPTDAYPSPPAYEVAIGRSQQDTTPIQPMTTSLTPRDFTTRSGIQDDNDEERDLEEERDYEESRPLKMGRIPDARAQYTFIQPNETLEKKVAKACAKSRSTTPSHTRHYDPHCHSQPHSHYAYPGAHHGSSYSHGQPYQYPAAPVINNVQFTPPPQPIHSIPTVGTYASPPTYQQPQSSHAIASAQDPSFNPPMDQKVGHTSDISIAGFKQKSKGVESCDEILEDPYQLYRFLVAHNDRPTLQVEIVGHHVDKHESYETDSHGHRKLVSRDVYVEDFRMMYDLTPYISPRGVIYTAPDPKTGHIPTLREAMEQYAEEENPFKEIRMHKTIQWDYEELKCAITHAIRSTNYRYTIDITFSSTNYVVVAKSPSPLARFMSSYWTKALCVLTCLGVCFYPARALYRKVMDKTIKSEFEMTISTRDFYMQNYWSIVDQIQYR
ncbi:hypothetical protein BGZ68_000049 [Mortierella alpina]|nr:hypothetical protein BGZ68_000049 [Mortierella alpina]